MGNYKDLAVLVEELLYTSKKLLLIKDRDTIYYRNKLYTLLNIPPNQYADVQTDDSHKLSTLVSLIYSKLPEIIQKQLGATREQAETRIINEILPPPSIVECIFNNIKTNKSLKQALDWYYQFSQDSDYIKVEAIAKNQKWLSRTKYGNLEITINLSKPEKDPQDIAKAKLVAATNYPKCLLCIENEGHQGNGANQPARHNHRMLRLNLATEQYYFQYSPYLYYPEHSIIINPVHKDMLVDKDLLDNFFSFTDLIPHYLIGSNTDIPIVGGSILTHDHYQAGNYIFPIEKASSKFSFALNDYADTLIEYLNWPVSTLKLTGGKDELLKLSLQILDKWYNYSNPELDIICATDNVRHNAITPIMRKINDNKYIIYLLLRNNCVSTEHPDGIFHPHSELHHIKKENIGLIEAMGLAILPGRLASELSQIKSYLLNSTHDIHNLSNEMIKHQDWLLELQQKYSVITNENINEIIQSEVANRFALVLEHAGVFKQTVVGDAGLNDFMKALF